MNVDDALKYSGFKSMTQKNSFIESQKNSFIERQEPIKDDRISDPSNRDSQKTYVRSLSSFANEQNKKPNIVYTSLSQENPFELSNSTTWYTSSANMKCTKNVRVDLGPKLDAQNKFLTLATIEVMPKTIQININNNDVVKDVSYNFYEHF
jgi:hypothetical protein